MKVHVLYGTESGNCELIAEDLIEQLKESGCETELNEIHEIEPGALTTDRLYVVVCSTHGDGEVPNVVKPFIDDFDSVLPDLSGVVYAMFGLGDRFYEATYSQGSEHIDRRFAGQGAKRIGEYGRHDASSWDDASEVALEWIEGVLQEAASLTK
ncbi:MioC protein [Leucobacter exalbidus]|uniref:MioC protein n=1 Tax=Leucobacter exalbidus TaxID=662960 RepID=A0A940PNK1_9MICO|nr:flavodoxin domain-containing protein [Leucobacter exalbidus]MBP1326335.1 MioC protein [Leucobacter exalbidus]